MVTALFLSVVDWLAFIPSQAQRSQWSQWLNSAWLTGQPVLLAFNSGESGGVVESWSDEQVVADAMALLHRTYGSANRSSGYALERGPIVCGY